MDIDLVEGKNAAPLVDPLYERNGAQSRAREIDLFFIAREKDSVIGCVRFCRENDIALLRSMMIDADYRRKGVGRQLLNAFSKYVRNQKISPVYCVPYSHLETFYGQIGFRKINDEDAPDFLIERLKNYSTRKPRCEFVMRCD